MIEVLEKLDTRTAVGVLARAALALESDGNPAAKVRIDDEERIRDALWQAARGHLGIGAEDRRPEAIERVGDWLDELSEELLGAPDTPSVLARLAERGDLPSDLYEIQIVENVLDIYKSETSLQKKLIEATVRSPDLEQHYGLPETSEVPALVSLFSRSFRTRWPAKDFSLIVAAQRGEGLILHINQAWRIYPLFVNTKGTGNDLVRVLEKFADLYGADIQLGGRKGHFFVFVDEPMPKSFSIPVGRAAGNRRRIDINVSGFQQIDPENGREKAALVVSIDTQQYQTDLKRMAVREDQILNSMAR
jgi:hypothetical protein